ncbi:MAG: hypothetical protein F4X54_07465 [Chloroflexi bacterium]|nr:hypothetical protein [Chloroflexota bacterium]MYB84556.1 hypothetical protein [Chloroflexota bacterium]
MYSDEQLRRWRSETIEDRRPQEFRRLKQDGELEAAVDASVRSCVAEAERRIASGEMESAAWNYAVRTILLETDD